MLYEYPFIWKIDKASHRCRYRDTKGAKIVRCVCFSCFFFGYWFISKFLSTKSTYISFWGCGTLFSARTSHLGCRFVISLLGFGSCRQAVRADIGMMMALELRLWRGPGFCCRFLFWRRRWWWWGCPQLEFQTCAAPAIRVRFFVHSHFVFSRFAGTAFDRC